MNFQIRFRDQVEPGVAAAAQHERDRPANQASLERDRVDAVERKFVDSL